MKICALLEAEDLDARKVMSRVIKLMGLIEGRAIDQAEKLFAQEFKGLTKVKVRDEVSDFTFDLEPRSLRRGISGSTWYEVVAGLLTHKKLNTDEAPDYHGEPPVLNIYGELAVNFVDPDGNITQGGPGYSFRRLVKQYGFSGLHFTEQKLNLHSLHSDPSTLEGNKHALARIAHLEFQANFWEEELEEAILHPEQAAKRFFK